MLDNVMLTTSSGVYCQGVEFQLDRDYLAFGAVVQRCQARKRIVMMNTGDIGARSVSATIGEQTCCSRNTETYRSMFTLVNINANTY